MLKIMINNWYRLMEEKAYLIAAVVMTICAVGAAVILTNQAEVKGNIALINESASNKIEENIKNSSYFNMVMLDQQPPMSELVQGRYDAVIIVKEDGSFDINTVKSREYKESLESFLTGASAQTQFDAPIRQIGTNIIGYMMMFLLMQGVLYARLFAEDKEKRQLIRVAMSPVPFRAYLAGQGAFIWLLIFIPSLAVIAASRLLGVPIGFTMLQYVMLLGILSLLSAAFALCLNSFFCVVDTANMLGSSIIVLTSILAGSFYSITKEHTMFNRLLHILPQKDFINFTDALEKGSITAGIRYQLLYVLLLSILMLSVAVVKTKRDYVYQK